MVHRDVKPANLLIEAGENTGEVNPKGEQQGGRPSPSYTLKVSDFGLARLKEGGIQTSIGKIRGTLAYMSPEQCRGLDLDGRSDLYALGIILFELSTGRRPFDVKSPVDALYKHIYEPPPSPRHFRPDLPPDLEKVILRCLAKNPSERLLSCAELADNLQSLVKRGVLIEESPQAPALGSAETSPQASPRASEQPDVSTALFSLTMGILVEPPEILEEEGSGENAPTGAIRDLGQTGGEREVEAKSELPTVRVFDQAGQTLKLLDLTGDGLTVGRLSDNDFTLESEGISRHHLRIDWDGSAAFVTDLGSRNGTFLRDGTRLKPGTKHPWHPDESLRIGRCWLRLEQVPQGSALPSPRAGTLVDIGAAVPIVEPTLGVPGGAAASPEAPKTMPGPAPIPAPLGAATIAGTVPDIAGPAAAIAGLAPKGLESPTLVGQAIAPSEAPKVEMPRTAEIPTAPPRPAAGPIELSLEPVQLRLTLGQESRLSVRLRNQGVVQRQLGLSVAAIRAGD
jgi:eukaryotic-like serine/threonine-protein kinase